MPGRWGSHHKSIVDSETEGTSVGRDDAINNSRRIVGPGAVAPGASGVALGKALGAQERGELG